MVKRRRLNYKFLIIISLFIVLGLSLVKAIVAKSPRNTVDNNSNINTELKENTDNQPLDIESKEKTNEIVAKITAVGDIIYHDEQLSSAYNETTNSYDFNDNFEYIKSYIENADFSLATCETTFAGAEYDYSGYPLFNTPTDALDSLKNAGFDMLSLASNHLLDVTEPGFFNSVEAVKEKNFDILGVRSDESEANYIVKDINGIKIGFTSYCFETANLYGQRTLNSIPIPYSIVNLINTFGSTTLESDLSLMNQTVANMKSDGAEFIIFVMHWGDEYSTEYSSYQEEIAKYLNSFGVDVILGSHPHVVQPIEKIKNESTSKETLVFYSLGNFLSNQRLETMGNSLSANGALAQLEIQKDSNGVVSLKNYDYVPTWVYKYTDEKNKTKYKILPVKDVLDSPSKGNLPQSVINELEESYNSTTSILGQVN